MEFLIIFAIVLMVVGYFGYNPLRKKWAGIIGVGGSYIVLLGVGLLVMMIGSLISLITGGSTEGGIVEVIISVIAMLLCLAYMVYVMLTRCETIVRSARLPLGQRKPPSERFRRSAPSRGLHSFASLKRLSPVYLPNS